MVSGTVIYSAWCLEILLLLGILLSTKKQYGKTASCFQRPHSELRLKVGICLPSCESLIFWDVDSEIGRHDTCHSFKFRSCIINVLAQ